MRHFAVSHDQCQQIVEIMRHTAGQDPQRLQLGGALVLRLRDQVLPIADLGRFLGFESSPARPGVDQLVVIMRVGSLNFGIVVDGVNDVQEIVVKPLGQSLAGLPAFSGNTILGDGSVVLILDPPGLAKTLGLDNSNEFSVAPTQPPFVMPREPMRLIVFRAGPGALMAAPLQAGRGIGAAHRGSAASSILRCPSRAPISFATQSLGHSGRRL